jgi:oligosaccharide repeat unit polymerase
MNVALLYLDIVSCLTVVVLSKLFLKSLRNPIFVICAWWSACLFLSNIVVIGDGMYFGTHLVFLLFIYSIMGFGIIFHANTRAAYFPINKLLTTYRTTWMAVSILIYLLTIGLGVRGYQLQREYGIDYRMLSFSTDDYSSLLYGNFLFHQIARFVLAPPVLFGVIALPVAGIFYANYKVLLLGFIFAVAVDMQGAGRVNLYYFIWAMLLANVFMKRTKLWLHITLLTTVVVAAGLLMLEATKQRRGVWETSKQDVENALQQFVQYHVLGFYLFDRDFSNYASRLYEGTSLGRLSLLAYPDKLLAMTLRRLGFFSIPPIEELSEYWQNSVFLGYDENGLALESNAFYTSLYPIFYDFGYLGIVFVPGLFVYFLVLHYKTYLRQQNFISLFVVIFLTIFFITSIFTCKIVSNDVVAIYYCIILLSVLKGFQMRGFRFRGTGCKSGMASPSGSESGQGGVGRLNRV